mmetsp:Transcript_18343/g.29474  ORF Transcript_18343/g.29474 Transcript_18343/m.29474 type:complete len:443 (+) Transcript_18343:10113-11441(+)
MTMTEGPRHSHAKIGVTDWDGVLRGKYLSSKKLEKATSSGISFCEVLFGWDLQDTVMDGPSFAGWDRGFPDNPLRILPQTKRSIPYEDNCELYLAEFAGRAEAVCPRGVLRRTIDRAASLGLEPQAAVEFEFFVFDETPQSLAAKGFRGLEPITPGSFGYSLLREGLNSDFFQELLQVCEAMNLPLEGLHTETGPGVIEAALAHCDALEAADRAALFKSVVKILAQRRGWTATFMAKWSDDLPGQSGHLHISATADNHPAFHDANRDGGRSEVMDAFLAGQEALMPEVCAMFAPTANSYRRFVPGYWAPTRASWGIDNRTCALRVIPGSPESQRIEYRASAADINPYLALSAAIGSGLWGVEHKMTPTRPVIGNAYEQPVPDGAKFPTDLAQAASYLQQSKAARDLFGDLFVDSFSRSRIWEAQAANAKISDIELSRYFELI